MRTRICSSMAGLAILLVTSVAVPSTRVRLIFLLVAAGDVGVSMRAAAGRGITPETRSKLFCCEKR